MTPEPVCCPDCQYRVICMYCKRVLQDGDPGLISHGICPEPRSQDCIDAEIRVHGRRITEGGGDE